MRRLSLLVGLGCALAAPAGALRADLRCPEPVFRAGEVRSGVPLRHRFRLVNGGPTPVEVAEVKPGCGCLRPQLDRRLFRPGEEGTLDVEVNTLTQPEGPNTWRVVVRLAGGAQAELPLFLTADVVSEVSVRPANLVLYTDTALSSALTLRDRRPRPLTVRAALTTCPHVRAQVSGPRRDEAGGWSWGIALEVQAGCPEGRHEAALHLHTADPTYPELQVPFTVVKRSPRQVRAVPAEVSLLGSGGQALPARVVLLGSADGRPVAVEAVEASHPAVRCTWAPGPGPRATLRIQVERDRFAGDTLEASVRVRLSKPGPQALVIPVRCALR
jgi:hypothetical protein